MSLQKLAPESHVGRAEQKKIKPNSVKNLLLLSIINDIPENYENLSIMWKKLQLNSLKMHNANDLKLSNLILGIQSHGSTYPSHICECRRPDRGSGKGYEIGPLRTLGMIRENARLFKESGGKKSSLPKYKSCQYQPLLDDPDSAFTILLVPPSELHLLTGPVNHIYKVG